MMDPTFALDELLRSPTSAAQPATPQARHAQIGALIESRRRAQLRSSADLAMEAGLPIALVEGIEQGSLSATAPLLRHLLACLDVPLRQSRIAQSLLERAMDDQRAARVTEVVAPMRDLIDRHPAPGLLMSVAGDIYHLNDSARGLMALLGPDYPAAPLNWLQARLHPAGLSACTVNRAQATAALVQRARRDLQRTGCQRLAEVLHQVLQYPGVEQPVGSVAPPAGDDFAAVTLDILSGSNHLRFFSSLTRVASPLAEPLDELIVELLHPIHHQAASGPVGTVGEPQASRAAATRSTRPAPAGRAL